ncbi:M20/M25/M40 family metallo-hydrolase [Liquorilactobacillus oeni]|uniref:Succinyl-diaminopimelate desuccinylase n=1 Tax=Liquorilactobacillus oeni DSM 19972 TaxID=1423777 RepID=A0A0R1M908_9LACO|nr:M20/M25/M40 family metallo-hydrolase [Liquorilactobacillus oeni]KRL04550.1 succinyl-diaminopimelate desuccinylase [Liquorilactobacillus oeni DSM 19972]
MVEIDSEKLLSDLININTVNGNEKEIADYLEKIFQDNNIKTKRLKYADKRETLVAEVGTGEKPVLAFDGHEDTVAFGNLKAWEQSPLEAKRDGDVIYGRGASDMKSGLAAEVLALLALKKKESELKGTVRLFATVGEEVGELGAEQIMQQQLAADVDALVVGEPTGTQTELLKKSNFYMSRNLSQQQIADMISANQLGEQYFVVIGHKGVLQYKVVAHGKSAHSSMPELGHNAIEDLFKFVQAQTEYFSTLTAENDLLGAVTPVMTLLGGGEQVNTVPDKAEIAVNIRTLPEKDGDSLEKDIKGLIKELNEQGADLEFKVLEKVDPVYSKEELTLANLAKEIAASLLEQQLTFAGMSGGTDASFLTKNNPDMEMIVFGPGNISESHKENEFVNVKAYKQFIKIYTEIAVKFLERHAND